MQSMLTDGQPEISELPAFMPIVCAGHKNHEHGEKEIQVLSN